MHAWIAPLFPLLFLAPPAPGWLGVYLDGEADVAVVTEVIPDSPAAKAGIEKGDVLLAVGDRKTATREAFVEAVRQHEAGARVQITLRRGDREQVVVVRLGERPATGGVGEVGTRPPAPAQGGGRPARPAPAAEGPPAQDPGTGYLGIGLRETDRGVVVDRVLPDGPAASVDLKGGDLLRRVGDKRVRSLAELDAALGELRPGQRLEIQVERTGDDSATTTRSVVVTAGTRPGLTRERLPAATRAVEQPPVSDAKRPESTPKPPAPPTPPPAPPAKEPPPKADPVEIEVREVEAVEPPPAAESRPARAPRTTRVARPQAAPEREAAPATPAPARGRAARSPSDGELERELDALRRELAELRRMLEELRRKGGE